MPSRTIARGRLPVWVQPEKLVASICLPRCRRKRTLSDAVGMSASCRFCCKSPLRRAANNDSILLTQIAAGQAMMGRLKGEQAQLFYQFELDDAVPEDHLVRKIDA